ncbi:MAG: hypothetical protein ACOZCF_05180 [Bacillota bacterium]
MQGLIEKGMKPKKLAADKGYDDSKFRQHLVDEGISPYIQSRYSPGRLLEKGFEQR